MTPAIVQTATGSATLTGTGSLSVSATFPSPVTAGNAVLVLIGEDALLGHPSLITLTSITDNLGNSYRTVIFNPVPHGMIGSGLGICGAAASGSVTVTVQVAVTSFGFDVTYSLLCLEMSGLGSASDVSAVGHTVNGVEGINPVVRSIADSFGDPISISFGGGYGSGGPGIQCAVNAALLAAAGADVILAFIIDQVGSDVPLATGGFTFSLLLDVTVTANTVFHVFLGLRAAPILDLPALPPPRSIDWHIEDEVGVARSPFTRQQQACDWQNALLRVSVVYPPMKKEMARAWFAFLAAVRGVKNSFRFGDPLWQAPQNPAAVAGAVVGAGQTGFTLITSSSGLTPGDWIQIGDWLYLVNAVSGGTLSIWPNLRESPPDATPLILASPRGLFRMIQNQRKLSVSYIRFYGLTIEIEEAI